MSKFEKPSPFIPMDPPELSPAVSRAEREANWERMREYFTEITDRVGMKVEDGIKEVVIGLNVFGFTTRQSCEGHLDRGYAYPWIDFAMPEDPELVSQSRAIDERIERLRSEGSSTALAEAYMEYHRIGKEISRPRLEIINRLLTTLGDFYQDRAVPYDRMLIISSAFGRIHSQGGITQDIADPDSKKQKLLEYQEEMHAFGAFLKERYLKGEDTTEE